MKTYFESHPHYFARMLRKVKMYLDRNQRDFARKLRSEMTEEERLLWRELQRRQLQGLKFRRQAAISRYVVDFVCFERRLIVELDGGHHNASDRREHDAIRSEWLEAEGFRVLRFWNFEVQDDASAVVDAIWIALQSQSAGQPPTPSPSPPGGGG